MNLLPNHLTVVSIQSTTIGCTIAIGMEIIATGIKFDTHLPMLGDTFDLNNETYVITGIGSFRKFTVGDSLLICVKPVFQDLINNEQPVSTFRVGYNKPVSTGDKSEKINRVKFFKKFN